MNQTIAIVGESGSGKSTLVDLITLALKPTKGDILYNKVKYDQLNLNSLRSRIGFVSQDMVVFDDTIANNVSLKIGLSSFDKNRKLKSKINYSLIHPPPRTL